MGFSRRFSRLLRFCFSRNTILLNLSLQPRGPPAESPGLPFLAPPLVVDSLRLFVVVVLSVVVDLEASRGSLPESDFDQGVYHPPRVGRHAQELHGVGRDESARVVLPAVAEAADEEIR